MTKTMEFVFHMPFGKHKGTPIEELPELYMEWCLGQRWLQPGLREMLSATQRALRLEGEDSFPTSQQQEVWHNEYRQHTKSPEAREQAKAFREKQQKRASDQQAKRADKFFHQAEEHTRAQAEAEAQARRERSERAREQYAREYINPQQAQPQQAHQQTSAAERQSRIRSIKKAIYEAGYKSLAMKLHPDRGGDAADFVLLQEVIKELRGYA